VPGADPSRLKRPVEQFVQDAPELALGQVIAFGGSLDIDRKDQAVHRAAGQPHVQAVRYRREQNAHLPSPQVIRWCHLQDEPGWVRWYGSTQRTVMLGRSFFLHAA
jgi:hypothetical protein